MAKMKYADRMMLYAAQAMKRLAAERDDLRGQIDTLAAFIMAEIPGEPSQPEGAVDTAIRLLRAWKPATEVPKPACYAMDAQDEVPHPEDGACRSCPWFQAEKFTCENLLRQFQPAPTPAPDAPVAEHFPDGPGAEESIAEAEEHSGADSPGMLVGAAIRHSEETGTPLTVLVDDPTPCPDCTCATDAGAPCEGACGGRECPQTPAAEA